MFNYLEYFKLEAKCLLKDFKKSNTHAIEECHKYFGEKSDLTLMNMQHIIAKKYGFYNWNELIKADNAKLAEVLICTKNKQLTSPFSTWDNQLHLENQKIDLTKHCQSRLSKLVDKNKKVINLGYGDTSVDISTVSYPLDVNLRHANVSDYDFSNFHISRLLFNENTIWPQDSKKMPLGPTPLEFIKSRKNPGLNINTLHLRGITGKDRNIAIISNSKLVDHLEYHSNVIDYQEAGKRYDNNAGGLYASVTVGKKCGIAPEANLYHYAVSRDDEVPNKRLIDYAMFINKICELHKQLLLKNKNGIDSICLAHRLEWHKMLDDEGFSEMQKAIEKAKSLNIFVISNSLTADYGFNFGQATCKIDGDFNNIQDYVPLHNETGKKKLFFPFLGCASADFTQMGLYMYTPFNVFGPNWLAGLYTLAKSVKESLSPTEFWKYCNETAFTMQSGQLLINPCELINKLS